MLFWLGILVGICFMILAVKKGFYASWIMLFNCVISIYLGIFLSPLIGEHLPAAASTDYNDIIVMAAVAGAVFLVLHTIAYTLFIAQFGISFPKLVDVLGAGAAGFVMGFLVFSFAVLLVCLTPFAQGDMAESCGMDQKSSEANIKYLSSCCDKIHRLVSNSGQANTSDVIKEILHKKHKKKITTDPNEPDGAITDPNSAVEPD